MFDLESGLLDVTPTNVSKATMPLEKRWIAKLSSMSFASDVARGRVRQVRSLIGMYGLVTRTVTPSGRRARQRKGLFLLSI